jgi:catechol-2,3-dioxygenase
MRTSPLAYGVPPPFHRLPDTTRVGGVRLLVSDLTRSRAFYADVLGLRPLMVDAGQITFGADGGDDPLVTL